MNSWFWGNILIGGVLGSTTDGMSGAMNEFSPDHYLVILSPNTPFGISTSKARKIKEMATLFGDQIRIELLNGGGEKTDAIISLIGDDNKDKNSTMEVLKKLATSNTDDLEFANKIIESYAIK